MGSTSTSTSTSTSNDAPAKLQLDHISMVYAQRGQRFIALRDVSLDIGQGEFISLVGASGCGKTTLLRIVDGLVKPTVGQVCVDGRPVTRPGPDRGFVFQQDALFPWRTVLDNIIFGLEVQGKRKREALERADELVRLVGLTGFERHFPHELSGGMRQRANLARALTIDPEILLMDEPFAALDAQTRELMQAELLRVWRSNRKTVMFVTHQIDEAVYLSDRVVVMTSRPGQIKAVLEVDIPRPRDLAVKRTPRFLELVDAIWKMIEEEVKAALRVTEAGEVESRPLAMY
jgi:NitT/TauT family transport system ATP-binding protein